MKIRVDSKITSKIDPKVLEIMVLSVQMSVEDRLMVATSIISATLDQLQVDIDQANDLLKQVVETILERLDDKDTPKQLKCDICNDIVITNQEVDDDALAICHDCASK